jgi:flagellin
MAGNAEDTALTVNGIQVGNIAGAADAIGFGANVANAINLVSAQSGVTASSNAASGQVTLTAADGRNIALGAGFGVSSGLTGSTATTVAGAAATTFGAIAANTSGLTVNGVQIGAVAAGTDVITQGQNMAAAINLVSSQSGVTAVSDTSGVITLTNDMNGPITMGSAFTGGDTVPVIANAAGTATTGTVSLASTTGPGGTITVSGSADGLATAGLTTGAAVNSGLLVTTSSDITLNNVDLSTSAGASAGLAVIDGALNMVNTSSANLGAYQNRFTQTVSNLNSQNVNNTASRSRITDADFASETANLSRAQVLQQAGTAMLAQANQSAQGVLSLLR